LRQFLIRGSHLSSQCGLDGLIRTYRVGESVLQDFELLGVEFLELLHGQELMQ
jgi:hypothetical protein